jgi:diguanylate cyclase (GGDEF)-like protein
MFILQRGALVNQLQQAATTDAKTGLLNATTWEQLAHREISRAEREGNRLALLILDLDFFKDVNDRHGHLAGDAALVDVARCLTKELRSYDIIGRFGGEEFVAMLPDIELAEARRAAERIRARIALLPIAPSSNQSYAASQPPVSDATLSASIGVAGYPFHGLDLPTLLHRADAALYAAKQAGRNRVVIADHGLGRRSDGSRLPTR